MSTSVPEPFPDLDLPPRTPEQKEADRDRSQEQTTMLMAGTGRASGDSASRQAGAAQLLRRLGGRLMGLFRAAGSSSNARDVLLQTLTDRRHDADSVVQFEPAPTDTGLWSLVVPGQLLVRNTDGDTLSPLVDQILRRNSFSPPDQGMAPSTCPELEGRLTLYTYAGDDDAVGATRTAMQQVQGQAQASGHLVTALHQAHDVPPTSGDVVAKAAVGPSPTKVDQTDDAFQAAGSVRPAGSVVVAVIDTGIADVERQDGWLNEVDRTGAIDPLDEFEPPGNGYLDFAAGHGTFAAGIVRMVDPDAQIRVYRALDSDGFASENAVACAMIKAVKAGAEVLNLSNGMHTVDDAPSVAFQVALEVIDEYVASVGRPAPAIVASAGNYGNSQPVWPAAFTDRVISVAALTADLQPAPWSSHGDWVTCSCVGQGIVSTFVPGKEDPVFSEHDHSLPDPDKYPLEGQADAWAVWSGTSFAAPQIAGAISRTMREEGGIAPRAASWRLLAQGAFIPGYGKALRLLPGT